MDVVPEADGGICVDQVDAASAVPAEVVSSQEPTALVDEPAVLEDEPAVSAALVDEPAVLEDEPAVSAALVDEPAVLEDEPAVVLEDEPAVSAALVDEPAVVLEDEPAVSATPVVVEPSNEPGALEEAPELQRYAADLAPPEEPITLDARVVAHTDVR